jgi:hypothetical protein
MSHTFICRRIAWSQLLVATQSLVKELVCRRGLEELDECRHDAFPF